MQHLLVSPLAPTYPRRQFPNQGKEADRICQSANGKCEVDAAAVSWKWRQTGRATAAPWWPSLLCHRYRTVALATLPLEQRDSDRRKPRSDGDGEAHEQQRQPPVWRRRCSPSPVCRLLEAHRDHTLIPSVARQWPALDGSSYAWLWLQLHRAFIGAYGGEPVVEPCTDLMGAFQRNASREMGSNREEREPKYLVWIAINRPRFQRQPIRSNSRV